MTDPIPAALVRVRDRVHQLVEEAREPALLLVALLADQGVSVRIGEVFRDPTRQRALFLQSRASLGEVNAARAAVGLGPISEDENRRSVTNAPPGSSWHEYRRALDLFPVDPATSPDLSDPDNPLWDNPWWDAIGEAGKALGFEWGGDWPTRTDRPHFQWAKGTTLAELRAQAGPAKEKT